MKTSRIISLLSTGAILIAMLLVLPISCTHDDQVIDEYVGPQGPNFSETELLSKRVDSAPVLDGQIDAVWDDAQKLINKAVVPDPGNKVFEGYEGNTYEFALRSLYDSENIYFLAEWTDNSMDLNRQTWYFDPETKLWKQEARVPIVNEAGVIVRQPFYEDKFSFLWNVDNSVNGWENSTCYASCHTGLDEASGFARHYTNSPDERIDMWHWKSVRNGLAYGLADDQYQDDAQPNGRHSDPKVSGGYTNNVQEFDLNGTIVKIPKYFIPNKEYYYWITKEEIDNGTAKLITAVDENGVLYYDGGSVDPNIEMGFQRDGQTTGKYGIPSVYIEPWVGNRGDLKVGARYTGSGWVLEIQRKLKTDDTERVDVDFSSLAEQPFGIGIFDNAGIAHAIKANLLLKFEN